ncbi:hypothetical protein RvY_00556 [Ramazzottius varieornatus]|uniref:Integrase zinc-binding domain-containing protein n=1 Tax=Ramazzottius varieornatus TaxID=947166 RepID=A0A1D1UD68_RAMVA|nr:hypothetical protein RvY_00556 [Ramazzottius varieornatus]
MSKGKSKSGQVEQDGAAAGTDETTAESEATPAGSQDGTQVNPGMQILDDEKLGHMCIVLGPATRKQLLRGEPLIIGTSNASVEAFFQKLISVCQMGSHMPVIFQTLSGAVSVSNIKKRKSGIITQPRTERYPVPSFFPSISGAGTSKKNSNKKSQEETVYNPLPEGEPVGNGAEEAGVTAGDIGAEGTSPKTGIPALKAHLDRDEIPLEAIRQYLAEKKYFPGWNTNAKRNLRKRCNDFQLDEDGVLLYKTKKGILIPCVEDRARRMNIIWEAHIVDHRRRDGLLGIIRDKYYWKGMFQDVNKVLDTCEVCKQHRLEKQNNQEEHMTDDEDDAVDINVNAMSDGTETAVTGVKRKASSDRSRKKKTGEDATPSSPAGEGFGADPDAVEFQDEQNAEPEKYPETSEVTMHEDMTS